MAFAEDVALRLLLTSIEALGMVADIIGQAPTPKRREEARRLLSGVIADAEIVRLALER